MATLREGDRVLVTRLDYLGDVITSLPLVDAIKSRHPGIEVDYLTRRPAYDLLCGDSRFARVFEQDRGAGLAGTVRLINALRRRRYKVVVDLYSNPRSAWLSWFSGAGVRIGGDRRGRRHLYTHAVSIPRSIRSCSDHHMGFGVPLGISGAASRPAIVCTESERTAARELLAGAGVGGDRLTFGVHPGGKWDVKRWPAGSFAELIALMQTKLGARVVVFTGPDDSGPTAQVRTLCNDETIVLDPMPIRHLAAVVSELDAVVLCDGGVMHLAVAVGTPTVGIFGSAEPDIWFPYEKHGPYRAAYVDIECRPCHRHVCPLGHTNCLTTLSPQMVCDELEKVVAQNRASRGGAI